MTVYERAREMFDLYAGKADDLNLDAPTWIQVALARWEAARFGATLLEQRALNLTEEIGELAEAFAELTALTTAAGRVAYAVLKYRQKTRGVDLAKMRELLADALGDIGICCAQLATAARLDFWTLYQLTALEVMNRGGDAVPSSAPATDAEVLEHALSGASDLTPCAGCGHAQASHAGSHCAVVHCRCSGWQYRRLVRKDAPRGYVPGDTLLKTELCGTCRQAVEPGYVHACPPGFLGGR